jgi:hypothetical protein
MAEKNSLWKNIRNKAKQNRRTGAKPKKPTAEMLRQERKIKAKQYPDGGPVNTLEGDLISKVIMNRNRDKDFVQRAYAVGEYPESNMFVQPDANEFGQKNSHLMGWGEDKSGQAYMYPEVMNPNNEAIKVPNQYADYISSTGYKKATGIPYAVGGPTKSLVQPPVLLDDNIIYPTDNPYMPGVNKDILDSDYDSYMRWREGFINTEGVTPEEFFQTYPSRQEWERKNFDPANLHNGVSLAQGGPTDGKDDPFKSTLNEGVVVSKPAQDWVSSWVQDPEFANRLNKNFPDHASKLSKKFYGYKEAKERAAESNLKSINKAIPGVISDIYDTQFLYNTNPEINSQLLNSYRASYNDPEYDKFFEKNMSKNPQGFTDEQGRIVITNAANDQYGPQSVSVHELMHKTGLYDDETFDRTFKGKFLTPSQDRLDKDFNRGEMYPFLMQMRFDNNFQPGEIISPERLKQIKESGYKNHLFKYYTDDEISKYLNTLASNQTQAPMQYAAQGGYVDDDDDKNKKNKTRVYTDPREFRIAQQNYNDSLAVYNHSQNNLNWYNKNKYDDTKGVDVEKWVDRQSELKSNVTVEAYKRIKPDPINSINVPLYYSTTGKIVNGSGFYLFKKPEVKPILGKPEIESLPSKPYKGEEVGPGIMPTPPNVDFGKPNLDNFFEGTYEKYKRSSYEDPMYRVWISGQQQQIVPESEFKKLSNQYLLKDLEAPDPGGNLYDKPKATGGYMYPNGGEYVYVPDSGIEQFAPDQSWYEGNPNAADPGNIVSWPSYPNRIIPQPVQSVQTIQSIKYPNLKQFFNRFKKKEEPEIIRQYYPVPIHGPIYNIEKSTGGYMYDGGPYGDGDPNSSMYVDGENAINKFQTRDDGTLLAPSIKTFEVTEEMLPEQKIRQEAYEKRLNEQKAFQEKWYPGSASTFYDPQLKEIHEQRANIYADDAAAKYILDNHSSRNDYKNRQTYLQSFTPWQREVIEKSNYNRNLDPDIGTQFRMAANKLIGRDYLGAQRMNYDEDITREDYENASRLGIFSPLMYPINAVKGIVKGEGKSALSGEIASPWVDATDMGLGYENSVVGYDMAGDIILDPLNLAGTGVGRSIAKGVGNLVNRGSKLVNKVKNSDVFAALTYEDFYKLSKEEQLAYSDYLKAMEDEHQFEINELYPAEDKINLQKGKVGRYFINKGTTNTEEQQLLQKVRSGKSREKQIGEEIAPFTKEGNSIVNVTGSRTSGFTTTGEETITKWRTGEKVLSKVEEPSKTTKYTLDKNNKISVSSSNLESPRRNPEYVETIKDNIKFAEESVPGLKIFGSSVGVADGGLHHLTGDLDGLITQSNYNKYVKGKYDYVKPKGPAEVHDIGKFGTEEGHIDFNIIHEDADGNVMPFWQTDMTGRSRSLEVELFRQVDPEGFYKASRKAIEERSEIKIPYKAQELLDKVDPTTKTIIDAYEAQKSKHINRIDAYINYGNIDKVIEAQDKYIKSAVGTRGNLGHQFNASHFSDVNENLRVLNQIEFIGDYEFVAKDPKRMQAALNDYYINNSVLSRQVDSSHNLIQGNVDKIEDSLSQWYPDAKGGSARGEGLNNVKFGDPEWMGDILSHRQLGLTHNTKSPLDYAKSIKRQTDGGYVFNQDELTVLENLMKKHFGEEISQNISKVHSSKDLLKNELYNLPQNPFDNRPVEFFDDVTKELGIRSISQKNQKAPYGNSIYSSTLGKLDKIIDTMEMSQVSSALHPKSYSQRLEAAYPAAQKWANSQFKSLDFLSDFKRVSNLLDGGYQKIQTRISSLEEQLSAYEKYKIELKNKFVDKNNPEFKAILEKQKSLRENINRSFKHQKDLQKRMEKLEDIRRTLKPQIIAGTGVGVGTYLTFDQMFSEDPIIKPHHFNAPIRLIENLMDPFFLDPSDINNPYSTPQNSHGGYINPYMYYSGGPMQYDVGGKVWKNIAAGLYGAGEGILDTITMGATDQLTDKGFDWLTKVGNKNIDLNDPDDVKFLKTQQQVKGYSNAAGAIGTAIFTGNVQGAIGQGTKGLNTAFQASDWATDDFKKWSQGISGVAGIAAGFAGGLNSDSFNAAAKAGTGVAGFGQKAGKIGSFGNQTMGMIGGNKQSLFQQAQAREELLKSPEYLAMQAKGTRDYVNQGLSFDNGGNINNNSLNLQNSMRDKYKNYRTRYSKGGTTLEKYGINLIPKSSGLHHENAYGGVPIGPNAMAEGGEYVLDDSYVVSDEVNGQNTQTDEFGRTMAENLKRRLDKYTLRDLSKYKGNLRRPMDPLVEETINQIKQRAIKETELARAEAKAKEEQRQSMVNGALQYAAAGGKLNKDITKIVEEEYAAAYGGYINPKKYKGLNMPGYSKGGKLPKEVLRARVESHMSPQEADAYVNQYGEGGGIHIKDSKKGTFTTAATKHGKSVQEFARQVLANKGNYSSAMVKKANFARNAAGWKHAHGGPVVSNVNQDFDLYAQNRGGMMMAQGGNMYSVGGPPYDLPGMADMTASEYNSINTYLNNLNTPNFVDNQGNTSSILSRRNKNKSTPVEPIERMQSRNLQRLPTDNTPLSIINNYPESSYRPATLTEEEQNMLNRMSNTVGFIPSDVMSGKLGTSTAPFPYEEGPINTSIPREINPEQNIRFVPPGGSDIIEDLPGFTPNQTKVSDEAIGLNQPNLPKLTFTQSDATKYGLNPNDVNIIKDPKVNQPNQGLTGLDYASMAAQAAGPLSQLYYGLKGPDDVNYERIKADKIDPYRAITLANKQSRQAQDLAGYNLKQNAPTSGSYMSNMRGLGLQAANQRGAQTAGIQYEADVANTQMQNQVNAQNAQIAMQEQIDRLQEKDAARTNVTEGLSGIGSSTANMIRDYRTNQVNKTISNNIGTGNFKLVPDGQGGFKVVPNTEGGTFTPTPYNNPYNTTTTASTGYMTPVNPNTTTPVATPTKSVEFTDNITDQKTGDAFRAWVNTNYPAYAKTVKLDPSGKYDNNYIKEAWKLYGNQYLGQ